ncbi:excalibur calcium-binding domain-containing protein [Hafnia alvei]|uniref:excalibur calcium-binding domain-containing protein n=1 Tax=Hafnia TaxID=568 RepID=UPI0021CDC381|nr:excalibur calcium-binding domain-containing protein [Hafnia alvei]
MKKMILMLLIISGTAMGYECDGRQYCSQMTSCGEASWFIENCPGMRMDGDHDGVPCESQWCGSNATYSNRQPVFENYILKIKQTPTSGSFRICPGKEKECM